MAEVEYQTRNTGVKENRSFLKKVLESGLACGEIKAEDLLAHITPEALARHLPVDLKAKLLGASLDAKEMTPELVVEVVGPEALAEHTPVVLLWRCIETAVERGLKGGGAKEAPAASAKKAAAPSPKPAKKAEGSGGSSPRAAASSPGPAAAASRGRSSAGNAESTGDGSRPRAATGRGAGAATRKSAVRRTRASTETDPDASAFTGVPAKPNASAYPEIEEVELADEIDELVADEPSDFGESPSVFDIDTKVGGPGREAIAVGETEALDDKTSPGK